MIYIIRVCISRKSYSNFSKVPFVKALTVESNRFCRFRHFGILTGRFTQVLNLTKDTFQVKIFFLKVIKTVYFFVRKCYNNLRISL